MTVGEDGRIRGIGPGDPRPRPPAGRVLDVGGAIVAPGFVSAHSHLFTSGSRGLGTDQSLYGWIDAMTRYTRRCRQDDVYWLTRHGALDFLGNGVTTAFDFTDGGLEFLPESAGTASFATGVPPAAYQHAQLRTKVDAGIRYVHSVMPAQTLDERAVLDHLDEVVGLARPFEPHPCHLGMAISGTVQWAGDERSAALELAGMRRHGLINQPHLLETPYEVEAQREKFAWYRRAGALGPDLVFGHFVHATDEIMVAAADAGCGAVWQPTSNGRLASGIADVPRWRELGMRVGVGLDDQACTDLSDPFQNMRMGIYLLRAARRDSAAMGVVDMLDLHTLGSAEVLGIQRDVGSLEVGKYADFLVVDPRRPDTGPVWDAYGTYVLACGLRNLRQVFVGGRLVSEEGRLVDAGAEE
ncbi:MAG TPA: amidohydrolase family protein, partial [Frankiaceae bacterium]|nr:amidohydrolase family protein [Frankiaceae bacterium]